ncbi:hypothetical protein GCM10009868_19470 [Terrabacter aerolatus]|uniref:CBM2 domain-containing protein n=1 Tax=Terrabacter aerolatus TaxID=422442 RepID=A0A512D028_9MICO|nr:hypothetical protein [Terrabacter aerolatus]GEO29818.1 hypothetical protein TAE01_16280 [Terrabacter aerolatus]
MNARRTLTSGVVALSLATSGLGALALAAPASAKGAEARTSGTCAGLGAWKLVVKSEDRALEVDYELDTNRSGQHWRVNLADNGVVVTSGTFTTAAPGGSFEVRRVVANRAGTDRFTATATNTATGATCRGALTFAG